jgi:hypothetical protein
MLNCNKGILKVINFDLNASSCYIYFELILYAKKNLPTKKEEKTKNTRFS